jgi:hypothetical protein
MTHHYETFSSPLPSNPPTSVTAISTFVNLKFHILKTSIGFWLKKWFVT